MASFQLPRARPRTAAAVLATILTALTLAGAAPAWAYGSGGSSVVSWINEDRAWAGVAPLESAGDLRWVASSWASELASGGYLAHNPSLPYEVDGWYVLGENVGRGPSVGAVYDAWLNSGRHWANIADPSYNQVGVGVAQDGYGDVYVVAVFAGR